MPTIIRGGGSSLQKEVIIKPSLEEQVILPEKGYRGFKFAIVEPMPRVEVAEPQIEFSSSTGVFSASVNQNEGYVLEESITVNYQLDTQKEQFYTPSTQDYILIEADKYTLGPQIVKGDNNLISDNIKYGKTIFNVEGSYKPKLQTKTISPDTKSQEITFDANEGYEGLEKVVVEAVDLLAMYPVGSIYMTMDENFSPSGFFKGGTWELLKDRFLIGAGGKYSSTGGEERVTLTIDEMPAHSHTLQMLYTSSSSSKAWIADNVEGKWDWINGRIGETGGGQSHNNMPPYLPVYMWQRIA